MGSTKKVKAPWLFIIGTIICLFCLFVNVIFCSYFHSKLNEAYFNIEKQIINLSALLTVDEHIQLLKLIQKNTTLHSSVFLVYCLFGTGLIIVCLWFLVKNGINAKTDEKNYKLSEDQLHLPVDEADKTMGEYELLLEKAVAVEDNLKTTEDKIISLVNDANTAADSCKLSVAKTKDYAGDSSVVFIRVAIIYALEDLRGGISAKTNDRIQEVCNAVNILSGEIHDEYIGLLHGDLKKLQKEVERCRENIDKTRDTDTQLSDQQSFDWYDEQLKEAIEYCSKLNSINRK